MSGNINTIILEGRASKEPDYQKTQTNKSLCRFSIANNRYFFSNDEIKNAVCFFEVVGWGRLADKAAINIHKGSHVLIEGELRQDSFISGSGERKQKIYILASNIKYLDKRQSKNSVKLVSAKQKIDKNIEEALEVSF